MKYKVCVYAICKNEIHNIEKWVKSMSEADQIYVLDTGSEDGSVQKLKLMGVNVIQKIINPWRFDIARNIALQSVPEDTDICVCTDLDETFNTGWREKLELFWAPDTTMARYRYIWNDCKNSGENIVFLREKIHSRKDFKWVCPVHEYLLYTGTTPHIVTLHGVCLRHHPDSEKSREQYLPLLELSVHENPENDRHVHYLGREYFFYKKWDECIRTLKKHLEMPNANWKDERCASMRYIAKSYAGKYEYDSAEQWGLKAICEAPYLREPYIDMALILYYQKKWEGVIYFINSCFKINYHSENYLTDPDSWNGFPHDLISIAYFYTGKIKKSIEESDIAVKLSKDDKRIENNNRIIKNNCK